MEQRKTLIITGVVILLILTVIFGTIYYLIRIIQNRAAAPTATLFPQATQTPSMVTPSPLLPGTAVPPQPPPAQAPDTQVYNGPGFQLTYPASWGLLTCSNSRNFEFDPTNNTDQRGVLCDRALKPVTVLVTDNLTCQGESIRLGSHTVIRSTEGTKGGNIDYRWCVVTAGVDLDITHRVSTSGGRAHSTTDFSEQIEKMISTLRFGTSS